jgi:membrane fusion protein (multidrug efflux system)
VRPPRLALAGAGALAALAAAALAACGGDAGGARNGNGPPPPVVEVATVERITIDEGLSLIGQLEPWESVMLRPETQGVIDEIEFQEGQEVRKGDVLFRLRDDEQQARLREAEAQLALAERAYKRANELAGERILAASELDQATANRSSARARIDLARVELERMTIRAPFDGVVAQRLVSPGNRVDDQTDLVKIDAVAKLRLAFALPEPIVDQVRTGMPFDVSVAAFPNERFPGEVYFVAPSLDPRNRHLLLKGEVGNVDRRLRPGMFANIRVETERREEILAAPESAIIADPAGAFVYRIAPDGTAERVGVELGLRRQGKVEVRGGLAEGDRVVSAGTNKVVPGKPVELAAKPGTAGPAASAGAPPARSEGS